MSKHDTEGTRVPRGFIFGAIIVGVLVIAAVVLIVTAGFGGGEGPGPTTPEATSAATAPPVEGERSVCGLDTVDLEAVPSAAPYTDWTVVGTMAAPTREDVGPGVIDADLFRSCYARTSEGALFAAANIWAMGTDSRLGAMITERLVAPGPGRDAAIAREQSGSGPGNGLAAQIAGFKILSYDGSNATVDIAFRLNTGALVSVPQALQWVDGDWKVVLNSDGQSSLSPSSLQSLGGYIPWAGVS